MARIRVVAVVGLKYAGKTTVTNHLQDTFDLPVLNYADPVKAMLRALGLTHDELYDPVRKELPLGWPFFPLTPRRMMQTLGTSWGQGLNTLMWVHHLHRRIEDIEAPRYPGDSKMKAVIVGDVRFKHEIKALRKQYREHLLVIHVHRPKQYTLWARLCRLFAHKSERGLKVRKGDVVVSNGGSISDLQAIAARHVRSHLSIPYG